MRQAFRYARGAAQVAAFLGAALMLSGCETLSLTLLGIGGSAAVNHQLSNTPSRTFTVPLLKVKSASLVALRRMGIRTDEVKKWDNGELITARVRTADGAEGVVTEAARLACRRCGARYRSSGDRRVEPWRSPQSDRGL